jgi:histidinol-phosphatase (PHP family)
LLGESLAGFIAADIVPEINTSSLRQGLTEPMPGTSTLARYAQLGGKAVSLGSDAHKAEHIGADFASGLKLMHDNILDLTIFCERERINQSFA